MCGRYEPPHEEYYMTLQELLDLRENRWPLAKAGELSPGDTATVIARSRSLALQPYAMHWGYHRPDGKLVFNARSETAAQRPMFADGMKQRRCLIPAARYYEWEKTPTGKRKYAIAPKGEKAFFLAGIYRLEGTLPVFTVLTRSPAPEIAFIHDRMPVILPPVLARDWTDPETDAEALIRSIGYEMVFRPCG